MEETERYLLGYIFRSEGLPEVQIEWYEPKEAEDDSK